MAIQAASLAGNIYSITHKITHKTTHIMTRAVPLIPGIIFLVVFTIGIYVLWMIGTKTENQ